jgi:DNA polymerase/3'-5' exonuclease PolX
MDKTEKIVEILNLFLAHEQKSKNKVAPFKVRAYENALNAIANYGKPIMTFDDVKEIQGIGDKIRKKLYEIVETGDLEEAKELKRFEKVRDELLQVYGIGPAKADDLIDNYGVKTFDDLTALVYHDRSILTEAQLLGFIYYEDLKKRIPREEITFFENKIKKFFKENAPEFSLTVVGSYRRGLKTSGDIDILVTYDDTLLSKAEARNRFAILVEELIKFEFIVGVLAKGRTKLLAIAQLPPDGQENPTARRLDVLLSSPDEFACSLLYFTGSKEFNQQFRGVALMRGYTLNEYRLKKVNEKLPIPDPPIFRSEREVFDFLGIKWQEPSERVGPVELLY